MAIDPADKVNKVAARSSNLPNQTNSETPRKKQPRKKDVHVRLTEDEYNAFFSASEREGLSISALMRQATRRQLGMTR